MTPGSASICRRPQSCLAGRAGKSNRGAPGRLHEGRCNQSRRTRRPVRGVRQRPPGNGTAVGTAAGAASGALIGSRMGSGSGNGALIGAGLGALLGMVLGDVVQRRQSDPPSTAPPPATPRSSTPGSSPRTAGDPTKGEFINGTTWHLRVYIDPSDPENPEMSTPILLRTVEKVPWGLDVGQYRIVAQAYAGTQYGERLVGRFDRTIQIDTRRPGWFLESVRKTSARIVAGALALGLGLQLLPGCATNPKASGGAASAGGSPGTDRERYRSARLEPTPSRDLRRKRRPGASAHLDGHRRAGGPDGAGVRLPFGPIGAGAGALLGFIYGNLAKRDVDVKANEEVKRQEEIDAELDARSPSRRPTGPGLRLGRPPRPQAGCDDREGPPRRPSGRTLDHVRLRPIRPGRQRAGGAQAGVARATAPEIDADGFRPVYEGGRLVRRERDAQGDGRSDTILHYGADGRLVRREDSSRLDGRMDMWTQYTDGKMKSAGVRHPGHRPGGPLDLLRRRGRVARAESLLENDVKLTQIFDDGRVAREEWRRHPGGELSAVATHEGGKVVQREEDSAGRGRLDLVSVFDPTGRLVKQGRRADEGWLTSWRSSTRGPRGAGEGAREGRRDPHRLVLRGRTADAEGALRAGRGADQARSADPGQGDGDGGVTGR